MDVVHEREPLLGEDDADERPSPEAWAEFIEAAMSAPVPIYAPRRVRGVIPPSA